MCPVWPSCKWQHLPKWEGAPRAWLPCSKTEWGAQQDPCEYSPSTGPSQHYDNRGEGSPPAGGEPVPKCRHLRSGQCWPPCLYNTCPFRLPLQLARLSNRKFSLPRFPSPSSYKWFCRWQPLSRTLPLDHCQSLPRVATWWLGGQLRIKGDQSQVHLSLPEHRQVASSL